MAKIATIISEALARASASMMSLPRPRSATDELADDDADQREGHRRRQRGKNPSERRGDHHGAQQRHFGGAEQARGSDLVTVGSWPGKYFSATRAWTSSTGVFFTQSIAW